MSSRQSFAAIGPDLRAALVATVRKRVPESEVDDIVQSTLADAIASPHAPEDSESLRRWIFGVARNKVVDYHRRAGRELPQEIPENIADGKAPTHAEADLLRWAERHLPPGQENQTTLDWMLREGDGEKLEEIAETENVPAPRIRQRVSRLRRHLKAHWKEEVALLATLGVLVTVLFLVLRKKPDPIANDTVPRAMEIRKVAFEKCLAHDWTICVDKLDQAKALDPAGDTAPAVRDARAAAGKALTTPPPPAPTPSTEPTTDNIVPPPAPTLAPSPDSKDSFGDSISPSPSPTTQGPKMKFDGNVKSATPAPTGSNFTPSPQKPQAPPQKARKKDGNGGGFSGLGSKSGDDDFATKTAAGSKKKAAPKEAPMIAIGKVAPISKATVNSVNVKPSDTTAWNTPPLVGSK